MLVSLKWLTDYIDIKESPPEIADKLTMVGLEVDSVYESHPDFTGVITARIKAISSHPNADKLSICEIATDDREYRVVCGAPNIHVGDVVPLARVGAVIPGGYTIKHSKIRGEASEGMLCSEEELGLGDDASGIMILDRNLPLGVDLAKALSLGDTIFDVAVTPNRPDCLSIIGIAREIAALTNQKVKYPISFCKETDEDIQRVASVEILDSNLCPRYTARMIKDIQIKQSPSWLRMRLEAVGMRAINNVVDITNFVMMEYGQPLHAFDFRFLEKGNIIVRGAEEGEGFISLDEKPRTLKKDTLMICDGVKPVAIAGIMGGLNSEVREDTDTVLLESAYFNPSSIRKTSRVLGMSTDAAFRFERGVDPEGVVEALNRAASLIADFSGGSICKGYIDEYPQKVESAKDVILRPAKVNEILGTDIDIKTMNKILEDLEMDCVEKNNQILVTPPSFRRDLFREIDLIEEIARLNGYEKIPITLPNLTPHKAHDNGKLQLKEKIKNILNGQGYSEIINYSFTSFDSASIFGMSGSDEGERLVKIKNPLTEDASIMRTSLASGLLETMRKNINVGNTNIKLFEIGKIFNATTDDDLPLEKEHLGILITGDRFKEQWHFRETPADYYDLKGCLETLLRSAGFENYRFTRNTNIAFFHPGKSSIISINGHPAAGIMGEVHPEILEKMDVTQKVFICELDISVVLKASEIQRKQFKEIPRFPAVLRDVAFLVDKKVPADELIKITLEDSEELLENVNIFDVYTGKGIPQEMKSLALRFTYRSGSKTLADNEVYEVHSRIVEKILKKTGAKVRGAEQLNPI
ncbi:MAG: phenylalanine--tRNA ligase subunit beta [Syntrophales bacterium]|jgi:phenylalanyl-tRNA synthetase beta chain|nr:phenylalanine--tRNA ligase subunit beta [Syntrophales bacterium]